MNTLEATRQGMGVLQRLKLDGWLLVWLMLLISAGLAVLYSASGGSGDVVLFQVSRLLIGLGLMLVLAQVTPRFMVRAAPWAYGAVLILLVLVLAGGRGRRRGPPLAGPGDTLSAVRVRQAGGAADARSFLPQLAGPPRLSENPGGAGADSGARHSGRSTARPGNRGGDRLFRLSSPCFWPASTANSYMAAQYSASWRFRPYGSVCAITSASES